ncbi:surface carbohydrate biosynthesis protein [Lachnospiraceae bacterium C1.1]|nr:hypothetical protein [Lachnospiraceae bacterium C1.1]
MKNIDFALLFEHSAREIEALTLIKCELERRGYSAEIIYKHDMVERNKFYPKVVIAPFLYSTLVMQRIAMFGNHSVKKYLNLQWEQIFCKDDKTDIEYHSPKGIARKAAHISWGKINKTRLESFGVSSDHIFETGHITMDLCSSKFRKIYNSREELSKKYGLDIGKKWLLFISGFAEADPQYVRDLKINFGVDDNISNHIILTVKTQKKVLEWFKRILSEDPELQIIYRPHPSEGATPALANICEAISGLKIIRDESVRQWILVSDYISTWISTSIVEAFFMGKKCAILRPFALPIESEVEIMTNGTYICTYEEFRKFRNSDYTFSLDKGLINEHYGKSGDGNTYIRICDACEKILSNEKYDVVVPRRKTFFIKDIFRGARDILIHYCDHVRISKYLFGRPKQLFELHENNMFGYRHKVKKLTKLYSRIIE